VLFRSCNQCPSRTPAVHVKRITRQEALALLWAVVLNELYEVEAQFTPSGYISRNS
jgi:hypothetical protein